MSDLVAEHAALERERDDLRFAIGSRWGVMFAGEAGAANARLLKIVDRLAAIERTKTWKRRTQETK